MKVFDQRRRSLIYSDCGYIGRTKNGSLASSQYQDRQRTVQVDATCIQVESDFVQCARPALSPPLFVAFRLFTLTVGRLPGLAQWLKRRLVKTLIHRQRSVRLHLTRKIEFSDRSVTVIDRLQGSDGDRFEELHWGASFTTIHMGSSRYFVANELSEMPSGGPVDSRKLTGGVELVRHATVSEDRPDIACDAAARVAEVQR